MSTKVSDVTLPELIRVKVCRTAAGGGKKSQGDGKGGSTVISRTVMMGRYSYSPLPSAFGEPACAYSGFGME